MLTLRDLDLLVRMRHRNASSLITIPSGSELAEKIFRISGTNRTILPPKPKVLKKGDVLLGRGTGFCDYFYIVLEGVDCRGAYHMARVYHGGMLPEVILYRPRVNSFFYGDKSGFVGYYGRLEP